MKYMVMECHLSYAVVLDEEGQFIKTANLHYEVGQMVTDIIELQVPSEQTQAMKKKRHRWLYSLAAMAACLALIALPVFRFGQMPYASVYLTINPEVRVDVNRNDIVVGLEGMNADGQTLIDQYNYKRKKLDLVMDELVDKAIETGFLHEGGRITLTLDAKDGEWVVNRSNTLSTHLNEYLSEKLSVTIEIKDTDSNKHEVIIPVEPVSTEVITTETETTANGTTEATTTEATTTEATTYGDSDYDDSDYGDSPYEETLPAVAKPADNQNQTDYDEPDDDSQSDYEEPDDGDQSDYNEPNDGGRSNYDEPNDDGQSNYEEPDDDGQSDYDEPDDDGRSDYEDSDEDD